MLGGTGPINVAVTLDNLGDVLSPGNSPGIQDYTVSQSWSSFSYDWEVNNFTGTTTGTDFDQIGITGSLDLTGGSRSYILNVLELTAGNVAGLVPNFSAPAPRSLKFEILARVSVQARMYLGRRDGETSKTGAWERFYPPIDMRPSSETIPGVCRAADDRDDGSSSVSPLHLAPAEKRQVMA